jgi:hypothetical protein
MRRFRTHVLAVFGALVILSLSLSSAFGARPPVSDDETTNVGQQVSTFVHSLLAGEQEEDGDQDESEECDTDSDEDVDSDEGTGDEETGDGTGDEETGDEETGDEETGDEETGDEETGDCDEGAEDEDADEESEDEDADEQESQNHGQCVSAVAQGDEAGENGTHGWAVSLAARVTCWLEALADENADEDAGDGDEDAADESEATSEKPHGKSEAAHQRKADRGSGKPTWAGANAPGTHGNGHGKGGNH